MMTIKKVLSRLENYDNRFLASIFKPKLSLYQNLSKLIHRFARYRLIANVTFKFYVNLDLEGKIINYISQFYKHRNLTHEP